MTVTFFGVGHSARTGRRDDADLARALTRWGAARFSCPSWQVVALSRPASGWSNETVVLTVRGRSAADERLVARIPPLHPVFPIHDPAVEAAVLRVLAAEPVPAPKVVVVETDDRWVGSPFFVMSFDPGRAGPEAAALDPWLSSAPPERQRQLHQDFLGALAGVHAVDWRRHGLGAVLRGGGGRGSLSDEVAWWADYVEWATDGEPPSLLADAVAWCRASVPSTEEPASLCWGDARIGNVLLSEGFDILSLLDWECASIGPGEMDLAWHLATEGLVERLTGRALPGFMGREEVVACYEQSIGRQTMDLGWHEVFALTRSAAVSERLARLARTGASDYGGAGGEGSPVLVELARRLEAVRRDGPAE